MSDATEHVMLDEAFQAALQRYAHGNGSSASIARAAVQAIAAWNRRQSAGAEACRAQDKEESE